MSERIVGKSRMKFPLIFHASALSVVGIDYEGDHVSICRARLRKFKAACCTANGGREDQPVIDVIAERFDEEYEALSMDGYRVVAIAIANFRERSGGFFQLPMKRNLILLAMIAFFDPPKESAAVALDSERWASARKSLPAITHW